MTYRKLQEALNELSDEQLDMTVTVYLDTQEAFPVDDTFLVSELPEDDREAMDGVLEEDQPVLLL